MISVAVDQLQVADYPLCNTLFTLLTIPRFCAIKGNNVQHDGTGFFLKYRKIFVRGEECRVFLHVAEQPVTPPDNF